MTNKSIIYCLVIITGLGLLFNSCQRLDPNPRIDIFSPNLNDEISFGDTIAISIAVADNATGFSWGYDIIEGFNSIYTFSQSVNTLTVIHYEGIWVDSIDHDQDVILRAWVGQNSINNTLIQNTIKLNRP